MSVVRAVLDSIERVSECQNEFGVDPPRGDVSDSDQRKVHSVLAGVAREVRAAFEHENQCNADLRAWELTLDSEGADSEPKRLSLQAKTKAAQAASKELKNCFWKLHRLASKVGFRTFPTWKWYASYR